MEFLRPPSDPFANVTCKWKVADNEDVYNKVKGTVPYGPDDITYVHNSDGYRCDEFDDWTKHPYRILFAGCSLTEGVGLPLEHTWAKILHGYICDITKTDIPFWSIARGATGLDQMVRYMAHYMDRLRPQIVISYLPNLERRERYYNDFFGPWSMDQYDNLQTKMLFDERFVTYSTEKNVVMMELILEKYKSIMLCSAVDHKFDLSYIYLNNIKQCIKHVPKVDSARDGLHAGPKTNQMFADMMFEHFQDIIKQRLTATK